MTNISLNKIKEIAMFTESYYLECMSENPATVTYPIKIKTINEFIKIIENYIKNNNGE